MKRILWLCIAGLLSACSGSSLKEDETVIFFPTSAHMKDDGSWSVPIHHWIFEKEEGDISRKLTQKVLSEVLEKLGVSEEQASSPLTKKRLMWFLVDNEKNKEVDVLLDGKAETLSQSAPNGHAKTMLSLTAEDAKKYQKQGGWVSIKAQDPFNRGFSGEIQLIPETGVSVISDIDDTIKISGVLNKKALIKNTFAKPYEATSGFPEYYKKMQEKGAFFHYVSASPWQLYPSLKPFMQANYPKGTISLRNFRIKDSSFIAFLKSSEEYKVKQIGNIINRYPKHQFILIGDSGEHDPEVFTRIYKQYPENVKSIQLRVIKGSKMEEKRFNKLFVTAPKRLWEIYAVPNKS